MSHQEAAESNETLLALLSLGFDVNECQSLLSNQNITLPTAVERLLQERGAKSSIGGDTDDANEKERCLSQSNSIKQDTDMVTSRLSCSKEQEKIKLDFHKKEAESALQGAKRRKMEDKRIRQMVLDEIKADRQHNQVAKASKSDAGNVSSDTAHASLATNVEEVIMERQKNDCHIKVKLPNGTTLNHYFRKEDTLQDVYTFLVKSCEDLIRPILFQPFPRREFSANDMSETLEKLGMLPATLLVLTSAQVTNESTESTQSIAGIDVNTSSVASANNDEDAVSCNNSETIPSWINRENIEVLPSPADLSEAGDTHTESFRQFPLSDTNNSTNLSNVEQHTMQSSTEEPGPSANHSDGSELSGNPSENSENVREGQLHVTSREENRNAIRGAAERRLRAQLEKCSIAGGPRQYKLNTLCRTLSTLQMLCADCLALSLAGKKAQYISSIGKLSASAAEKVLQCLKERKLLTGKVLNAFLSCKLQSLDLSVYPLMSNEILESVRFHKTIIQLNLSLCSLITDQGLIPALKYLRQLRHLNLNDCNHISDKVLPYLAALEHLTSLNLDGTKVTDKGLVLFLNSCLTNCLTDLSLKRTSVTSLGLACEKAYASLISLKLDASKVSSLEFLANFPQLENLSLSSTLIKTGDLANISESSPCIRSLNLGNTDVSNEGLLHLKDLPLLSIVLPGRFKITDVALAYLQGLTLKNLDLTDFINITDQGMFFVGQMTSLRSLSLSNTKVTDNGLRYLAGLDNLEDLNLDNLKITETGLKHIAGVHHLHTLSLANTELTGDGLDVLNNFQNLVKLNLSRTNVCDDNIGVIKLPWLRFINLDYTFVSPLAREALRGCPLLTVIRASSCDVARSGL